MSEFLEQVKKLRPDLSDWVVHYTKGPAAQAKEALRGILNDGLEDRGHGICFTESPISHFSQLFQFFGKYKLPMLAPYGVAVKKDWLFHQAGRPVIYLREAERQFLQPQIAHLFEEYEPGKQDFTWLREWRTNLKKLPLSKANTVVITPNLDEAYDLAYDIKVEYEYQGRDMEPLMETYMDVDWPFVTLEEIQKLEGQATSDEKLVKLLREVFH